MKIHPESAKLFQYDKTLEKAKNAALRLLSRRAYTRKEVVGKLKSRGFEQEAISHTLETLDRLGLVNDQDFARRWILERMRLRPMGPNLLVRDLRRRGIDQNTIDEAIDEILEDVDLPEVAEELLRSRMKRYEGLSREKALTRMFGFLGRRGFHIGLAREAAQKVWQEIESSTDDPSRIE